MAITHLNHIFSREYANGSSWNRWLGGLLIVFVSLALNLLGNARTTLWDRDEPRYAESVREMRTSGDWIVPHFNGEPRYQKPILIYWLMLASTSILGDNPFAARAVSALAGSATCLLVGWLALRIFGARVGLLTGLCMATAPIIVVESKLATTDAALALWIVCAQMCLWELNTRKSVILSAAFFSLMALAMLTKGPVGLAMVAAAGLATRLLGGPAACWRNLQWRSGLCIFLGLALPWFVVVGFRTHWEFYSVAVGEQIFGRVARGVEKHDGFPGYYVVTTLLSFHPWSALLPAALAAAWTRRRGRPELAFLLGWVVGPWLLLEIPKTKLVHYYLPAIPACALLVAWLVDTVAEDARNLRRWPLGRLSLGLLVGVAMAVTVALCASAFVLPWPLVGPVALLALVVAGGTLWGVARFQTGSTWSAAWGLTAAWGIVMAIVGGWLIPAAEPFRTSRIIGERLASLAERLQVEPVLGSYQEPAVVYVMGKPMAVVPNRAAWLARVQQGKSAVTALLPLEASVLRREQSLDIELLETKRILILNHAQSDVLQFVRIRPRSPVASKTPTTRPTIVR